MNSKRFYFVLLACIVILAALFVGGAYQSTKLLQKEGDTLVKKKLEKTVLDKKIDNLHKSKRSLTELQNLSQLTSSIIPKDKDQARTIVEIDNLAKAANIKLGSIEFPASNLGNVTKQGKKSNTVTDNTLTQLTELSDLKGVYVMDVTINSVSKSPVPYSRLIAFLEGLEKNRRTAQVVSVSITPDTDDINNVSFNIILQAYVKPE